LTVATESPQLERLQAVLAEIADLSHAQQILEWDARVSMPHAGAKARADVASTMTQLAHGRLVSDEVGKLLADLDGAGHDPESAEGALIRITRREWERASRIPSELAGEMAQADIITGDASGYVVPHEAILVDDSGNPYVVQAVDMVAKKVSVRVLVAEGDQDVVDGPLDPAAPVVLAGNHQLDNGMRMHLANPDGTSGK